MKKILLIEDDELAAAALSSSFVSRGYDVTVQKTAETGLQSALQTQPEIIILDWHMQDKTGEWLLGELRKDTWGKNANVIVMTADDTVETVNTALRNNVTHFYAKNDIDLNSFVDIIERNEN